MSYPRQSRGFVSEIIVSEDGSEHEVAVGIDSLTPHGHDFFLTSYPQALESIL